MNRFFDQAMRLSQDAGFMDFQNQLTRDAYDALGQAYAANSNEVDTVTKLVDAVKDKEYDQVHISASKIHGSRSYVEFNFRDKPTTKELGDMAVITVVTSGKNRLLQRLCIIQNKKAKDQKWVIDPEQLFLLKPVGWVKRSATQQPLSGFALLYPTYRLSDCAEVQE